MTNGTQYLTYERGRLLLDRQYRHYGRQHRRLYRPGNMTLKAGAQDPRPILGRNSGTLTPPLESCRFGCVWCQLSVFGIRDGAPDATTAEQPVEDSASSW
jgi:hypothetical protein